MTGIRWDWPSRTVEQLDDLNKPCSPATSANVFLARPNLVALVYTRRMTGRVVRKGDQVYTNGFLCVCLSSMALRPAFPQDSLVMPHPCGCSMNPPALFGFLLRFRFSLELGLRSLHRVLQGGSNHGIDVIISYFAWLARISAGLSRYAFEHLIPG